MGGWYARERPQIGGDLRWNPASHLSRKPVSGKAGSKMSNSSWELDLATGMVVVEECKRIGGCGTRALRGRAVRCSRGGEAALAVLLLTMLSLSFLVASTVVSRRDKMECVSERRLLPASGGLGAREKSGRQKK